MERIETRSKKTNAKGAWPHLTSEIDGVPVCVAEVLSDNRTVSVIVPFNSNSGSIRKLNGSYFIDECKLDNDLPNCYNMPRLVEIISGLKSKSFEKRQAHNPVEGFN